jgi:hypothetical protein
MKLKLEYIVILILIALAAASVAGYEYTQRNMDIKEEVVEEEPEGLVFKQLDGHLYSLTGRVNPGDCEKLAPQFPDQFVVILESPGGSLADGMCIASHFKLRKVVTVVRDTPYLSSDGEVLYEPGLANTLDDSKKVVCASSCSLLFLGGDRRYLIGKVWFGIHGPSIPAETLRKISKAAIVQSSYQNAGQLLKLLKKLGVDDEAVRSAFIMIPGSSMYWLNPRDFKGNPALAKLATHYRNFWGFTASDPLRGM